MSLKTENLKNHSVTELEQYFKEYEPESKLILPNHYEGVVQVKGEERPSDHRTLLQRLPQTMLPPELRGSRSTL